MCNDRTLNIKDLVRFSTKATLLVPTFLLADETHSYEPYNDFAIAFQSIKSDDGLIITEREVDEVFSEITIEIRDD